MGWCLSLAWNTSKFYTIARILTEALLPVLTIGVAFAGRYIINILAGQATFSNNQQVLILLLIGILIIGLSRQGLQKLTQYCQAMHEDVLGAKISLLMMGKALSADLEYFDNPAYHDKLTSANRDSYVVSHVIWNVLGSVSLVISFLMAFIVLGQASFLYGVIMLMAAIPSSIVSAKYTKLLYRLSLDQVNEQRQMDYYQAIATDRIYAQDLRLFWAGDGLKDRYRRIWGNLFTVRRDMTRKRTAFTGLLECLPEIAVGVIAIDIALRVMAGNATVGDYSLFTGLVGQLWATTSSLSFSLMNIYDNKMKIENFQSIETFKNRVVDKGKKQLKSVESIEFEDVRFTYPGTKVLALNDICIHFKKKEKVALVGLNGSGKSTLIKLLLRMYDPDKGQIRINGTDIRDYTLSSLRKNFSVYFQDMQNYSFTLRENFTIADEEQCNIDENIKQALNAADCEDILASATHKLDTNLTRFFADDGIELSGGQHQKLAFARALFRRHTALILDEPSSNLDPRTERNIFESLKQSVDGKMMIFTSHRLSNVFLADRIVVLDKGRVVEDGTQQELLKNKQQYAELFKYQQDKYLVHEE